MERTSVGQGELIVVIFNAVTGVAAVYHHRGRALPHGYVCVCVCACVRACVRACICGCVMCVPFSSSLNVTYSTGAQGVHLHFHTAPAL